MEWCRLCRHVLVTRPLPPPEEKGFVEQVVLELDLLTRMRDGTEMVAFLTWEWQDQPQVIWELPEQVRGPISSPRGLKKLDLY